MMKLDVLAIMEDATRYEGVVDQRDIAAWETTPMGETLNLFSQTGTRWVTWHALKRTKTIDLTWEAFDAKCVEAGVTKQDDSPKSGSQDQ